MINIGSFAVLLTPPVQEYQYHLHLSVNNFHQTFAMNFLTWVKKTFLVSKTKKVELKKAPLDPSLPQKCVAAPLSLSLPPLSPTSLSHHRSANKEHKCRQMHRSSPATRPVKCERMSVRKRGEKGRNGCRVSERESEGRGEGERLQFPSLLFTAIDFSLSGRREETAPQPAAVSLRE